MKYTSSMVTLHCAIGRCTSKSDSPVSQRCKHARRTRTTTVYQYFQHSTTAIFNNFHQLDRIEWQQRLSTINRIAGSSPYHLPISTRLQTEMNNTVDIRYANIAITMAAYWLSGRGSQRGTRSPREQISSNLWGEWQYAVTRSYRIHSSFSESNIASSGFICAQSVSRATVALVTIVLTSLTRINRNRFIAGR